MQKYTVTTEDQPRIDQFITEKIPNLSRSSIQKLIKLGKVQVNDKPAKPSQKLKYKDKVQVDYDPAEDVKIPTIELPIIYQDDDVLVIDKPIGVLTHSKGNFNPEATVATFVKELTPDLPGDRGGIVHRLDRATSGVLITAKSEPALVLLQKEFSSRKAQKTYLAIVEGHLDNKHAIIDMPIERNPKKPATFRVGSNGKSSITEYEVIKSSKDYDLVELRPKTGRTHQLRVHMAKLGHPILGDPLYQGKPADRLYLHSASLNIKIPKGGTKKFKSKIPSTFYTIIEEDNE